MRLPHNRQRYLLFTMLGQGIGCQPCPIGRHDFAERSGATLRSISWSAFGRKPLGDRYQLIEFGGHPTVIDCV